MNPKLEVQGNEPLTAFCRSFIKQYADSWPPSEDLLASNFIKYFHISFLLHTLDLEGVCSRLGIEILSDSLPDGVYGYNFRLGEIRKVVIKGEKQSISLHTHTAFHEIREILEYSFIELGFPTFPPSIREKQADAFALSVMFLASKNHWTAWLDRAGEIKSPWRKAGAFGLIGVGGILFCFGLCFSAVFPYIEDLRGQNQKDQRYLT
jgi:hypothetical protein